MNLLTVTVNCMPNFPLYFMFGVLFVVCKPILSADVNQVAHVNLIIINENDDDDDAKQLFEVQPSSHAF